MLRTGLDQQLATKTDFTAKIQPLLPNTAPKLRLSFFAVLATISFLNRIIIDTFHSVLIDQNIGAIITNQILIAHVKK